MVSGYLVQFFFFHLLYPLYLIEPFLLNFFNFLLIFFLLFKPNFSFFFKFVHQLLISNLVLLNLPQSLICFCFAVHVHTLIVLVFVLFKFIQKLGFFFFKLFLPAFLLLFEPFVPFLPSDIFSINSLIFLKEEFFFNKNFFNVTFLFLELILELFPFDIVGGEQGFHLLFFGLIDSFFIIFFTHSIPLVMG